MKRSRCLEKKPNDADTSKLKLAAIETLLGSEKKQTLPPVFPRVRLANKFNDFFLSKIQKFPKNIPPVLVDLKFPAFGDFLETFGNVDNLYVVLVSNQGSSKSQPSRNMPSRYLKKLSFLYNQMSEIINESFLNAVFPTAFKYGHVIPIFKSGEIEEISNYRPITNLHFASKVIEKVIALQLKRFLDKQAVFDEHQSAYRNYHSTETALLDLTSHPLWGPNNKSTFLVISLDLSAAFDTVNLEILLSILFQIGIIGQAHSLIKPYLNGRTQCVFIDGSCSEDKSIETGVPQGSILGQVFFILYLVHLRSLLNEFLASYHIYADDITIYLEFDLETTFANFLKHRKIIARALKLLAALKLKVNSSKTQGMLSRIKELAFPRQSLWMGSELRSKIVSKF